MPAHPTNPHAYLWRAHEFAGSGVPPLLADLTDDDAVSSSGSVGLADALAAHRAHRAAAYAPVVGPLLVPAADLAALGELLETSGQAEAVDLGLVGPYADIPAALDDLVPGISVVQIEAPAAADGEDPVSGVHRFLDTIEEYIVDGMVAYAEVPLVGGLLATLDVLADARDRQWEVAAKFRMDGPTAAPPVSSADLADVICACRDHSVPFKLTGGLHRAVRHTDPSTGQAHHGFLNVLVATVLGGDAGAGPDELVEWLECTDAARLAGALRGRLDHHRPLLYSFGMYGIAEPLTELRTLGLLAPRGEVPDGG